MLNGLSKYRAPALEKGLDILELLAYAENGLLQSEIAERLGRKTSEIFRMLVVLRERGYIIQPVNTDRYELSLKLFQLAHHFPPVKYILSIALPLMRKVSQQLQQSCHIATFRDTQLLVIGHTESSAAVGFTIRTGALLDLSASSAGPVILAHRNEADLNERIERYREAAAATPEHIAQLQRSIRSVREKGFLTMDSTQVQGITDIACPILDFSGLSIAALTVPYMQRLDQPNQSSVTQVIETVRNTAKTISQELGYSGAS